MKTNALRELDQAGLTQKLTELLKEQCRLRLQKGQGEMKQFHLFKTLRRDIARVNTVLNERERAQNV